MNASLSQSTLNLFRAAERLKSMAGRIEGVADLLSKGGCDTGHEVSLALREVNQLNAAVLDALLDAAVAARDADKRSARTTAAAMPGAQVGAVELVDEALEVTGLRAPTKVDAVTVHEDPRADEYVWHVVHHYSDGSVTVWHYDFSNEGYPSTFKTLQSAIARWPCLEKKLTGKEAENVLREVMHGAS